jgi:acyl-CoA thioester hydrolase
MVTARLRVIYGDTDQMGVVYYANYFRYFEFSRSEFLRARGGSYTDFEKSGYGLPVIEAHCDYKAPARYDELLEIDVRLEELKRVSMRFAYLVRREADPTVLCTGHTVHACVGAAGRPTRIPESLAQLLRSP